MWFHNEQNKQSCPLCKVEVFNMKRHMLKHDKNKPTFPCQECGKVLSDKDNLQKHMRNMHIAGGNKKYPCPICKKMYLHLSLHMKIHTGDHKKTCPICNKPFSALKNHMLTHEAGRPMYTCTECNKSFTEMGNLKRHKLIHLGKQKKPCPICSVPCSNLPDHMLTHKADRPMYTCTECNKSLSSMGALKTHKLIHSGNHKQYKCSACAKTFTKSGLSQHMKSHTGKLKEPCPICKKSFTVLKKHMLSHKTDKSV